MENRPAVLKTLLAIAAVGPVLALAHALRPARALTDLPFLDDAFYALAVSRNMALGNGITIDGKMATNGFQPLWTFLNVPDYWLGGPDRFEPLRYTLFLSTLLWVAFSYVVASLARDRARRSGGTGDAAFVFAAVLSLCSYAAFRAFHNGVETGLHLLMLAVAVRSLNSDAPWTRARALTTGLILGLSCYARLDAALFVASFAACSLPLSLRERRFPHLRAASAAIAALLLAPWLLRNLLLDGHLMPTSGRAESLHVNPLGNVWPTIKAVGEWTALFLCDSPTGGKLGELPNALRTLAGLALVAAALRFTRRLPRLPMPEGTRALAVYCGALAVFYTFRFGAPHFQSRYLAPLLVLTVPFLSATAEHLWNERPRLLTGAALAGAAVNLALSFLLLHRVTTERNSKFCYQAEYVVERVAPECVVGAHQSGLVGYSRDRVINLDGKVNAAALSALTQGDQRTYVDAVGIDVFADWPTLTQVALGRGAPGFHRVDVVHNFEIWVREGRESCIRATAVSALSTPSPPKL